jgi:hypothetical protein
MRQALRIIGLAALVGLSAGVNPVSAQDFGIRIGPDRPRVIERREYRGYDEPDVGERRVYRDPRVIERRIVRPAPRRTVCTTRWREGRRVEVCRTVGRRF